MKSLRSHSHGLAIMRCMLPWTHYRYGQCHRLRLWPACSRYCWNRHLAPHHYDLWMSLCISQRRHPRVYRFCLWNQWGSNHLWSQTDRRIIPRCDLLGWKCIGLNRRPKSWLCCQRRLSRVCHHLYWSWGRLFLLSDQLDWKFPVQFQHPTTWLCDPLIQLPQVIHVGQMTNTQSPSYVPSVCGTSAQY
jgi:hypothetical protein